MIRTLTVICAISAVGCSIIGNPFSGRRFADLDSGAQPADSGIDGGPDAGPPPLATPVLRFPWNGYMTGSALTGTLEPPRNALRPLFIWEPVPGAQSYEIELATSCDAQMRATCTFAGALMDSTTETQWRPPNPLTVSTAAPVGRRYLWRVRACRAGAECFDWSDVRYVDVGRMLSDFDGNGYGTILASDPLGGTQGYDSGAIYYFNGPALAAPSFGQELSGVTYGHYGAGLAPVGDVRASGLPDLAVGASVAPIDANYSCGRAFVGLAGSRDELVRTGVANNDFMGGLIAGGGDFNGDGYSDFVVNRAATMEVYMGSAAGPVLRAPVSSPASIGSPFASAAASVDLNGDGLADLVLGADQEDGATVRQSGRVYVFAGHPDGLHTAPDATLLDPTPEDQAHMGSEVRVGDLNGDGFGDIVIDAGARTLLVYGGRDLALLTPTPGPEAGALTVGDFDGDGFADLFVSGALYFGSPSGLATSARTTWDLARGAMVGDLDADGNVELVAPADGALSVYSDVSGPSVTGLAPTGVTLSPSFGSPILDPSGATFHQ